MGPFAYYWNIVTSVVCSITLSPFSKLGPQQHPIGPLHHGVDTEGHHALKEGLFRPPGSNIPNFTCDYSRMVGWKPCQGTEDKSCWLISDGNTEYNRVMNYGNNTFNTTTDYEGFAPWGIRRNYTLYVTNGTVNADGMNFTDAKLFNGTFPGPLIEACWGDTVSITVINNLTMNGTSVHWHGIRQNQTMHMDGVNGVTQCPIAPDDSYTYIWNATQYGSSWYHSHYSVQYADGAHAPITIHGPSTANYDVSIPPTILTDWYHNSAFECLYIEPLQPDILINGIGNITRFNTTAKNTTEIPPQYHIDVAPPSSINGTTKYLIRLMNTAFETGFVFSIDNHWLTIVEADFVPVEPYNVTSLVVAIGQRYNIIVEAKPYTSGSGNPIPLSWNFWIRTYLAPGCHNPRYPGSPHYEKAAILHYINATSVSASNPVNSSPWPGIEKNLSCLDSLSTKLTPAFSWTVEPPENVLYGKNGEEFEVKGTKGISQYGTAFISLERLGSTDTTPFQTTYGNPSFLNLDNTANNWPIGWMVVPENYTKTDWVSSDHCYRPNQKYYNTNGNATGIPCSQLTWRNTSCKLLKLYIKSHGNSY